MFELIRTTREKEGRDMAKAAAKRKPVAKKKKSVKRVATKRPAKRATKRAAKRRR